MKKRLSLILYLFVYEIGALALLIRTLNENRSLMIAKLPEIAILTFLMVIISFSRIPFHRLRIRVVFLNPFYILGILMLGPGVVITALISGLCVSLGFWIERFKLQSKLILSDYAVGLAATFQAIPVLLLSTQIYQRLGGGSFESLTSIPSMALAGLAGSLLLIDQILISIFISLNQGKPPWVPIPSFWRMVPLQILLDLFFIPIAIALYLLYQHQGIVALGLALLPIVGMIWIISQFFSESSKRQATVDRLNVANELIHSGLNLKEMETQIAQKIMEIFKADSVDIFISEVAKTPQLEVGMKRPVAGDERRGNTVAHGPEGIHGAKNPGPWPGDSAVKVSNFIRESKWRVTAALGKSPWSSETAPSEFLSRLDSIFQNKALIYRDIRGNQSWPAYESVGLFSVMAIPLLQQGKIIGGILCAKSIPQFFTIHDQEFSNVLIGQLSTAIQSAQLHERLEITLKELRETQAQLIHSEKMAGLGKLVAGMAHELNNPLNFLSFQLPLIEEKNKQVIETLESYAAYEKVLPPADQELLSAFKQTLKFDELPAFFKKAFDTCRVGLERSKQIVDSLRTFARTETLEENWDYVDVHAALETTLVLLAPLHRDKITIRKKYGNIASVWGIPSQLNQVFMNVLSNAFEAIDEHGEIRIETSEVSEHVLISVRDSGKGIPAEIQRQIFEPFFTTKEVGQGTGLGLSIAYGIVQRHRGKIEVESAPEQGATFRLFLPIKPKSAPAKKS